MSNQRTICIRGGFATFSAVILIATTAIALTMFAKITLRQVKLASTEATDAQIRELLNTGQAYLKVHTPDSFSDEDQDIALPDDLSNNNVGSLILQRGTGETSETTVIATARYMDRTASQTLRYDETERAWHIVDVMLP